jgi:hypothetical protein
LFSICRTGTRGSMSEANYPPPKVKVEVKVKVKGKIEIETAW